MENLKDSNTGPGIFISKCRSCDCEVDGEEHYCPYASEINGDDTLCNCCDSCCENCALEI